MNIQSNLQSFLATIMAVSIAVERVVEILKQTFGNTPILAWLFTPLADRKKEALRCASIHLLSAVIGGLIAGASQITIPFLTSLGASASKDSNNAFGYIVIGLLSAGGSAFWNHALDLIKAAKVQQEQSAKVAVATTSQIPPASSVNL